MLLGCKDLTAKSPSSLSLETPAAARNVDSLFFEPTIYLLCEEKALIPNHELTTSFRNPTSGGRGQSYIGVTCSGLLLQSSRAVPAILLATLHFALETLFCGLPRSLEAGFACPSLRKLAESVPSFAF